MKDPKYTSGHHGGMSAEFYTSLDPYSKEAGRLLQNHIELSGLEVKALAHEWASRVDLEPVSMRIYLREIGKLGLRHFIRTYSDAKVTQLVELYDILTVPPDGRLMEITKIFMPEFPYPKHQEDRS